MKKILFTLFVLLLIPLVSYSQPVGGSKSSINPVFQQILTLEAENGAGDSGTLKVTAVTDTGSEPVFIIEVTMSDGSAIGTRKVFRIKGAGANILIEGDKDNNVDVPAGFTAGTVGSDGIMVINGITVDLSGCNGNNDFGAIFDDATDTLKCQAQSGAAAAGTPVGAGTELQHRVDGANFGAITGSSYDGTTITFGSAMILEFTGNSTAGQYIKMLEDTDGGNEFYMYQVEALSASITRNPRDQDRVIIPKTISSPVETNVWQAIKAPFAFTISDIQCIVDPTQSDGSQTVVTVRECDATADNCAGVDGATTITCDVDGATDDGSLSNPTIDANDWVDILIGGVTTTDVLTIQINGYMDSE